MKEKQTTVVAETPRCLYSCAVVNPNAIDHQTANAQPLMAAGAAVVVADADFDADRLVFEADVLMAVASGTSRLAEMGRAAGTLAHPEAADRVADLLETWARPGKGTQP